METDEQGVLTGSELENLAKVWHGRECRSDREEAAKAQHEHDVEAIKTVRNPFPAADVHTWRQEQEFEDARGIFLEALKAKADAR